MSCFSDAFDDSFSQCYVVTDEGERLIASRFLNAESQSNLKLRLFTNEIEMLESRTLVDFDEADVAPVTLLGPLFTFHSDDDERWATYPDVTFNFAEETTIYGFFVTDAANTTAVAAAKFSTPHYIPAGGGSITISLELGAD